MSDRGDRWRSVIPVASISLTLSLKGRFFILFLIEGMKFIPPKTNVIEASHFLQVNHVRISPNRGQLLSDYTVLLPLPVGLQSGLRHYFPKLFCTYQRLHLRRTRKN